MYRSLPGCAGAKLAPGVLPPCMTTPNSEHSRSPADSQPDNTEPFARLILHMLTEPHHLPRQPAASGQAYAPSPLARLTLACLARIVALWSLPGHAVRLAWAVWRAAAVLGHATVRRLGHEHREP